MKRTDVVSRVQRFIVYVHKDVCTVMSSLAVYQPRCREDRRGDAGCFSWHISVFPFFLLPEGNFVKPFRVRARQHVCSCSFHPPGLPLCRSVPILFATWYGNE